MKLCCRLLEMIKENKSYSLNKNQDFDLLYESFATPLGWCAPFLLPPKHFFLSLLQRSLSEKR
uniref:Uncharacterized protein n=1 Tax=Utricularia reniformis TaxID=192314 RepID=A0A1Y0AZC2_9LAMI|nr:hypothetical protein AEK19_MT0255 [Utricularia reniformis]ART30532.1 hypothetical protein AEK19_MT0255 [Utricularia reniformis]